MRAKRVLASMLAVVMVFAAVTTDGMGVCAETLEKDEVLSEEDALIISEEDEPVTQTDDLDSSDVDTVAEDCSEIETPEESMGDDDNCSEEDPGLLDKIQENEESIAEIEEDTDIVSSPGEDAYGWRKILDEEAGTVTLLQYVGPSTNITIPATMRINGGDYDVVLQGLNRIDELNFPASTKSITICEGVKAAEDISFLFNSSRDYSSLNEMNLSKLNIKELDTSNTKNMSYMFKNCAITSIDLSGLDTHNVTDMSGMFYNCDEISELDLSGFDTSNVENVRYMFFNCQVLERLKNMNFDTRKVRDMSSMFGYCRALYGINVDSFNTQSTTYMQGMFHECNSLESLDLSGFDTQNVQDMSNMFCRCSSLRVLDISNFDTGNVLRMNYMFWDCSSLTSLDVTSFDTEDLLECPSMFKNCSSLQTLDLSGFVIHKTTWWASDMFRGCSSLKTIYVMPGTDWNEERQGSIYGNVFEGCVCLSGDIVYDDSKTGDKYATVSGGYFTAKTGGRITLSDTRVTLYKGHDERINSVTLTAAVPTGYSETDLIWTSSNQTVATVNSGVVYAVSAGTATIKAQTEDGMYWGSCKITVPDFCEDGVLCGDWIAELDSAARTATLIIYVGEEDSVIVPGTLSVNGADYSVIIQGTGSMIITTFPRTTRSITIENGVKAAKTVRCLFFTAPRPWGDASGTSDLENINVAGLDTSETEDMSYMFYEFGGEELDISGFNTSKVTNTKYMFCGCGEMKTLDISGFDTSNVTDMSFMFCNCYELKRLDLSGWNTSKVLDVERMFCQCFAMEEIKFDSAEVTNAIFSSCVNFDDMFIESRNLSTLDVSGFDVSSAKNLSGMFDGCRSLVILDVGGFDAPNATDMCGMFAGCSGVMTLNMRNCSTSNVTNMGSMFSGCSSLTDLRIDSFDVTNVTDMGSMFSGCSSLETIDIGSFNPQKVTNGRDMFSGCSSLRTIYANKNISWKKLYAQSSYYLTGAFNNCIKLSGDIAYDPNKTTMEYATVSGGYFTAKQGGSDGQLTLSESSAFLYLGHDERISSVTLSPSLPDGYSLADLIWTSSDSTVARVSAGKVDAVSAGSATIRVYTSDRLFFASCSVTVTGLVGDGILCGDWIAEKDDDAKTVTLIINTSTDESITVPATISVEGMNYSTVLQGTNNPEISAFPIETKSISFEEGVKTAEDISYLFYITSRPWENKSGNSRLGKVNLSGLDSSMTKDMGYLFYKYSGTILGVSNLDTSNVIDMTNMFCGCEGVTTLDVSRFNTSNVTDMSYMFSGCKLLKTLDLRKWDTSNVCSTKRMFYQCYEITEIKISTLNTSKVTDMESMFYACRKLLNIDIHSFDTSNVCNMDSMFCDCNSITKIDVRNFNTSKVTNMANMFEWCNSLTSIDVSGFDTSNVKQMNGMFLACKKLQSLNLDNFDTSKVTNMSGMFLSCANLTELRISNFDISNVSTISGMFRGCKKLKVLDISSFDPKKVTNAERLFLDCSSITTIYSRNNITWKNLDFKSTAVIDAFTGCNKLVGDIKYSDEKTTMEYAKVKGGYFTAKDQQIVTDNLYFDVDKLNMFIGEDYCLSCTLNSSKYSKESIVYSISPSDGSIVTIDNQGIINAIGVGTAEILARIDGSSLEARCRITVSEKPSDGDDVNEIQTGDLPDGSEIPTGLWVVMADNPDSADGAYCYTGKAIKPDVRVYDGKKRLVLNKDYSVKYSNNTKAYTLSEGDDGFYNSKSKTSAPTITVTGKGNYNGREIVYFKIMPIDISAMNTDVFCDDISVLYTKKEQKPVPVLNCNGKKLKNKTDYTVEYYAKDGYTSVESPGAKLNAVKDAGEYIARVIGKSNYSGIREVNLCVVQDTSATKLVGKLSYSKIPNQSYNNGEAITPLVVVKDKGKTLVASMENADEYDYSITYENNTCVGTGYIVITGNETRGYSGTKRISFKITGISLKNVTVTGIPATAEYTGVEVRLDDKIESGVITLKQKKTDIQLVPYDAITGKGDYTVSYKNNIKAGKATITFNGINGFTGSLKKTFKITPYSLNGALITVVADDSAIYAKGGAKANIEVTFLGTGAKLIQGTDYTITYKNHNRTGNIATITIKGKGNYKDTYARSALTYVVNAKDIGVLTLNANDIKYQNKNNKYSTKFSITDMDGKVLKKNTDYENIDYTYYNNTDVIQLINKKQTIVSHTAGERVVKADIIPAGTVIQIKVNGKGNYSGVCTGTYRITQNTISSAKVIIPKQVYTGKRITLTEDNITVKISGKEVPAVDPVTGKSNWMIDKMSYKNNINKGKASVTIKGIGNYGGSKKQTFTIVSKGIHWFWRL